MADGKARAGLRTYLEQSKELGTSVVLVLPLFVAYQLGILATGGLRNGVDFVSKTLFLLFNNSMLGYLVFNAAILLLFGGVLAYQHKKGALHPRIFPWMLLESAVYALLLGSTVIFLINAIGLGGLLQIAAAAGEPSLNLVEKLVMSAGAGLYEEVVFRLFLMGGLFLLAHKVIGLPRMLGAILAVLASSVIFSAVHHISEPFTMSAFTFRIFAGLLFAIIFQVRGLAVAAYTHFLYDVYVMVFRQ
jgi:membrane protease YdiL (CAAX protease family)